jgi:hypothetical protein
MSEVKRYWVDLDEGTYPAQMHGCNDKVVKFADFDAQRLRADAAEAENRILRHSNASFLETVAKVCDLLGIDLEDAKHAEGQPSDVLFNHAKAQAAKLTAAEQRIADLDSRNRRLEILLRRASNYGGLTPDWHDAVQLILAEQKEMRAALNPNPEAGSHESN